MLQKLVWELSVSLMADLVHMQTSPVLWNVKGKCKLLEQGKTNDFLYESKSLAA